MPDRPPADRATTRGTAPRRARAGFRDDIQGMRALAVLAIMVFHAGISPYPGGFVTLDVFFVVSGFLITYLLLREIDRDGTLSLTRFYARRARRILPAATVVTIGVVLASSLWLDVVAARDAAVDALWAAFFAANVRFAIQETDYFAEDTAASPFQHYWSLATEEQFYLVLPLVLLACVTLAVRRGTRPRVAIGVALAVMTALSFAWSVHASVASPGTAYFSTLTRTWEFGVGALLALAVPWLGGLADSTRNLLAAAGLGAIVVACFITTETTPFPGYAALLPVLGTGAVMVAGAGVEGRPPLMQRILGSAPLRLIGDMSYSLYLWHWPMLTIAVLYAGRELRLPEVGVILVACLALSWATYRWVETPFRSFAPHRVRRTLVLYPLSLVVVLAGSGGAVAWVGDGVQGGGRPAITTERWDRAPGDRPLAEDETVALVQASVVAARQDAEVPGRLEPSLLELEGDRARLGACDYEDDGPWELCTRGDRDAERSVVVLGNSHGRHWIPAIEKVARSEGYRAHYLVKSACTPARVVSVARQIDEPWDDCTDFNAWAQEQIEEIGPEVVMISTSSPRAMFDGDQLVTDAGGKNRQMRRGFEELIDDVTPHADRVAVVGDVPRRDATTGECLGRPGARLADCLAAPRPNAAEVTEESRRAAERGGARYVDTEPWFCADGVCPAVIGDMVPTRDLEHITTTYAEHLARPLGRALGMVR